MTKRIKHPIRWLVLLGVLLIVAWLALKGWRIYRAANGLLAQQAEAEALLADGPMNIDGEAAEDLILGVRRDLLVVKRETAVFMPLTPYLGWLPTVGPLAAKAAPLMEMADAGTETAAYAFLGLKPALALLQNDALGGTDKLAELVTVLDQAGPDLAAAAQAFNRYVAARAALGDTADLPWRVRTLLEQADAYQPLAEDGLQVAQILPEFMGADGLRLYLLLAQNEEELRPTGGFIAGAGILALENGRIQNMLFADANYVDDYVSKPYAFPPQPLYDFMGLELFLLRDANFWPDFPISAQMAMDLYSYGQDLPPLDGAIAFDQRFMLLFVEALGSVYIPEEDVMINGRNVIAAMQEAWSYEEGQEVGQWVRDRKAFLGTFASAIMAKIQTDFGDIDPLLLVQNINMAIAQRHLQIYVTDPALASVLDAVDWDGRYENETGQDVLGVVDSNVGYNKVNSLIERQVSYRVDLSSRQAQLNVTYHHNGTPEDKPCFQGTPYTGGISYDERINTCYWNYLRIYTPLGTQLSSASQHHIPDETMMVGRGWNQPAHLIQELTPLTVIANAFLLPWAETLTSNYVYELPPDVVQGVNGQQQYQLTVFKQAGTPPAPLEIVLQLPPGATLVSATPPPTTSTDSTITFSMKAETNVQIKVIYQP